MCILTRSYIRTQPRAWRNYSVGFSLCALLFLVDPYSSYSAAISPILNRLGVDTLLGRMSRLREDERFKTVSPETLVQYHPSSAPHLQANVNAASAKSEAEGEVWFDWSFVDFWKSNYCK